MSGETSRYKKTLIRYCITMAIILRYYRRHYGWWHRVHHTWWHKSGRFPPELAVPILPVFYNRKRCLTMAGAVILLVGLMVATMVYLTATDDENNDVNNQTVEGNAYAITPRDSKQNLSDLKNAGGQAAVIADDFNWWVADLWHGKRLAYTLAVLAVGVSLACLWAANLLAHDRTEDQDR